MGLLATGKLERLPLYKLVSSSLGGCRVRQHEKAGVGGVEREKVPTPVEKAYVWWEAVGLVWPWSAWVIKVWLPGELEGVPLHCSTYRFFCLQLISESLIHCPPNKFYLTLVEFVVRNRLLHGQNLLPLAPFAMLRHPVLQDLTHITWFLFWYGKILLLLTIFRKESKNCLPLNFSHCLVCSWTSH